MSRALRWLAFCGSLLIAGCALFETEPPPDPDYNFLAHRDDDGVSIDRMEGNRRGRVTAADCPLFCSGPQLLLVSGGETQAAFWSSGPTTVVRSGATAGDPLLGRVEASWQNEAIRFTLAPEGTGSFATGIFARIDGGYAAMALGQPAQMTLEVAGVYRAEVVDAAGVKVGWLRVRVTSIESPARIYEGMLPPVLNGPLAAAVAVQLDAAIDAVLADATNPFLGN